MTRCPNCNCRDIGKIGTHQFYCWGCFIEFNTSNDALNIFQVEEDGTLSSLNDLFFDQDDLGEGAAQPV